MIGFHQMREWLCSAVWKTYLQITAKGFSLWASADLLFCCSFQHWLLIKLNLLKLLIILRGSLNYEELFSLCQHVARFITLVLRNVEWWVNSTGHAASAEADGQSTFRIGSLHVDRKMIEPGRPSPLLSTPWTLSPANLGDAKPIPTPPYSVPLFTFLFNQIPVSAAFCSRLHPPASVTNPTFPSPADIHQSTTLPPYPSIAC